MGTGVGRDSVSLAALALALVANSSMGFAHDPKAVVGADSADEAPVAAQQPASIAPPQPDEATLEITKTIVVTGSRIPRVNLTSASPVTTVDNREVKFEGTTNIEELLNSLPQVAPTQGTFLSNGATGTATVDLRELGPPRTLVLVNGRRLGPGDPTQPAADLNIIPPTLIKRVEIVTGGASSVYGSDAVSGVINFILDTRLDGIRIDGQTSVFQHDNDTQTDIRGALNKAGFSYPSGNAIDGNRSSLHVAAGTSLFGDRVHFSAYAGYYHQEGLTQASRDYSFCAAQVARAENTILFCGGSPASAPSNFVNLLGEEFHTGEDRTFVPDVIPFNFAPYNYYQRPDRRYTAGAFADAEISPLLHPYFEFMWLDDRSVAQLAPSGDFGNTDTINCDNPLLSPQQKEHVCVDGNFVGQEEGGDPITFEDPVTGNPYFMGFLEIDRRNVEGGARRQDLRHKSRRLLFGTNGDLWKGTNYDASYMHLVARMSSIDTGFFSRPHLLRAIDIVADPATGGPVCRSVLTGEDPACVPWNIFTVGGVAPDAIKYLEVSTFRHGSTTEDVANANATIDLGEHGLGSPWAAETPSVNLGAEYRKDSLSYDPDPLQFTGDLAGAGQAQLPVHGSTTAKELFAEARIPIVQDRFIHALSIEGGYRRSWYSNDQSEVSVEAYKLAAEIAPVRDVRLRASLQRAVRAPNIVELFTPAVDGAFGTDPCVGSSPDATLAQCQQTGVTAAQYGHIVPAPDSAFNGYNSITGGNAQLKPETATTESIGFVLEPRFLPGFDATIDWWDIKLKGAITPVGADLTMKTCIQTGDPFFCSRIHRDSHGSLWLTPEGFVDDRNINVGAFKVRGVDVAAAYRRGLGRLGSATVDILGTYYDHWIIVPGGLVESFDCAGLYGGDCVLPQPKWKHKARVTWTARSNISLSLNWRFVGAMKLDVPPDYVPGPFSKKLKAQSFLDLSASARLGRNYELRLGVNNIFDHEPPLVPSGGEGACGGGCNGNTYPQWYDPLGRFIFAGFTVGI